MSHSTTINDNIVYNYCEFIIVHIQAFMYNYYIMYLII